MSDQIKVTYQEIEIVYNEKLNNWTFTLRGRERSAESLEKAKEAIDKPPPKDKKPFERVEAWQKDSYGATQFRKVTVTSVAESTSSWSTSPAVWITYPGQSRYGKAEQQREKTNSSAVYPRGDKNDAIVAEYERVSKEMKALDEKRSQIYKLLTPLKVEKEEA